MHKRVLCSSNNNNVYLKSNIKTSSMDCTYKAIKYKKNYHVNVQVKFKKNDNLTARHINASFRRLYQCQSNIFSTFLSKITKYNRVPLGFDPSVARLLGDDPTPRPTCPVQ